MWEKCGTKSRERGVRNGNSDGLDSLIKFSIHIHSLARRKSIQVASSLVLPSCQFGRWEAEKTRFDAFVASRTGRTRFRTRRLSFSIRTESNAHIGRFRRRVSKNGGQSDARRRPPFYGRVYAYVSLPPSSTLSENKISDDRSQRHRDIFNRAPVAYVEEFSSEERKFSLYSSRRVSLYAYFIREVKKVCKRVRWFWNLKMSLDYSEELSCVDKTEIFT